MLGWTWARLRQARADAIAQQGRKRKPRRRDRRTRKAADRGDGQ